MSQISNVKNFLIFYYAVLTLTLTCCTDYTKPDTKTNSAIKKEATKMQPADDAQGREEYTTLTSTQFQNYCSTEYDR